MFMVLESLLPQNLLIILIYIYEYDNHKQCKVNKCLWFIKKKQSQKQHSVNTKQKTKDLQ